MRTRGVFIMTKYNSIKVEKGSGGWGGPLIITPTEQKHKFIYIVGGGEKPAIVDRIAELTGMEAVNGLYPRNSAGSVPMASVCSFRACVFEI